MASSAATGFGARSLSRATSREGSASRYALLAGRFLFSAIFIMAGFMHFSAQEIGFAARAGVPFASFLVPASGIVAALGGVSILLGYRARWGAWLIVLFLVPVPLTMHNFWAAKDAMTAQMQMVMFLKNVTIMGGALMVAYFGSGPMSLDASRS